MGLWGLPWREICIIKILLVCSLVLLGVSKYFHSKPSFFPTIYNTYITYIMLRRRTSGGEEDDADREFVPLMMGQSNSNGRRLPSAEDLLIKGAAKAGYADKQNNSILATLFPCWVPKFKRRYFILVGNFLYRYSSEHGESPKGVPIPIDSVQVSVVDTVTFCLSMIRKDYIIKCDSAVECADWVAKIKTRKNQAIRENMGHAPLDADIHDYNKAASKVFLERLERDRTQAQCALKSFQGFTDK